MVTLTRNDRAEMVRKLIAHKYEPILKGFAIYSANVANRLYADIFDKKTRNLLESLPNGFVPTTERMSVSIDKIELGGCGGNITFSGSYYRLYQDAHVNRPENVEYRVPHNKKNSTMKVYDASSELGAMIIEFDDAIIKLRKDIETDNAHLTGILSQFNTVEKLVDAWPEAAEFVPEKKQPIKVPAVPVSELNKSFGLPV